MILRRTASEGCPATANQREQSGKHQQLDVMAAETKQNKKIAELAKKNLPIMSFQPNFFLLFFFYDAKQAGLSLDDGLVCGQHEAGKRSGSERSY